VLNYHPQGGRRIVVLREAGTKVNETSLKKPASWVWWQMSIIPSTQEEEIGSWSEAGLGKSAKP
jgi:hypothetical protein